MIRATLRDGTIKPIDPIPPDWSDGDELEVGTPGSRQSFREQFHQLAAIWKKETRFLSSTTEIVTHPAYQRIIGMGGNAVPLILDELRTETLQWFLALRALTGENPVPSEVRDDVHKMAEAWLKWGKARESLQAMDLENSLPRLRNTDWSVTSQVSSK